MAMAVKSRRVAGRQARRPCSNTAYAAAPQALAANQLHKNRVQDAFGKERSKSYDSNGTFHLSLCEHLVQLASITPGALAPMLDCIKLTHIRGDARPLKEGNYR